MKFCPADVLFSKFIRQRDNWTCQNCGACNFENTAELHCSHYWGRGHEATRFDPENASAHCAKCHKHFTEYPKDHEAWKKARMSEQAFAELKLRAHSYRRKDRKEMAKEIRGWLKDISTSGGVGAIY